jgi:post-segregation antitoxin (ccd killing protein)
MAEYHLSPAAERDLENIWLYTHKATHVSQGAEAGLTHAVAEKRAELWLTANREALESSNAFFENNGLPLAHHRKF